MMMVKLIMMVRGDGIESVSASKFYLRSISLTQLVKVGERDATNQLGSTCRILSFRPLVTHSLLYDLPIHSLSHSRDFVLVPKIRCKSKHIIRVCITN